jgi:hypothetical protein
MSLPRFFDRAADAITPVATVDRTTLAQRLGDVTVRLQVDASLADSAAGTAQYLYAANLAARLYPRLQLAGPTSLAEAAATLAASINPGIDITHAATGARSGVHPTVTVMLGGAASATDGPAVRAAADEWNVYLDDPTPFEAGRSAPGAFAALAAAALAMSEVFRTVFARELGHRGRTGPEPGGVNLITLGNPTAAVSLREPSVLIDATLVGAGAIGQAALHALRTAEAVGHLTVVDPETVTLSNLQRYVLTTDADVGQHKTELARRLFDGTNATIDTVASRWGADQRTGPGPRTVLVALDSAADRLAVAASLPDKAYNAWTQPADIGWSWHERFGVTPCLACLYYPDRPRPSSHELIAEAIGQEPLRVLAYLVLGTPVSAVPPGIPEVLTMPFTPDTPRWLKVSLLDDLVDSGKISRDDADRWAGHDIASLYREGICAGGILNLRPADVDAAAVVPLAHQSAFAGIMLALSAVAAANPGLREHRPTQATEARLDMLRGWPQVLPRPRSRTPGCLCSDPDYVRQQRTGAPWMERSSLFGSSEKW